MGEKLLIRILPLAIATLATPCFTGCATVVSERSYPVTIDNSGGQTYFSVTDRKNQVIHEGVTPNQVVLDAKSYPFWPAKYKVTYVGTNDFIQQRDIKASVDPWLAGNILTGGVIGTVVDGVSGAMFKLPERVTGDVPNQYALTDTQQGAQIASANASSGAKNGEQADSVIEQVTFQNQSGTITQ